MTFANRFASHKVGRRYSDVLKDSKAPLGDVLALFDDPAVRLRLVDSELHHDRPALAGAVKEIEALPAVEAFFTNHDEKEKRHETLRFRQAVGVAVLIAMEEMGWKTADRKGSVPGRWFSRPEHYVRDSEASNPSGAA